MSPSTVPVVAAAWAAEYAIGGGIPTASMAAYTSTASSRLARLTLSTSSCSPSIQPHQIHCQQVLRTTAAASIRHTPFPVSNAPWPIHSATYLKRGRRRLEAILNQRSKHNQGSSPRPGCAAHINDPEPHQRDSMSQERLPIDTVEAKEAGTTLTCCTKTCPSTHRGAASQRAL